MPERSARASASSAASSSLVRNSPAARRMARTKSLALRRPASSSPAAVSCTSWMRSRSNWSTAALSLARSSTADWPLAAKNARFCRRIEARSACTLATTARQLSCCGLAAGPAERGAVVGLDGTNTTLNSGRILINLKPVATRKISASDVIRRLQPELAKAAGITLFMQPVQDLSVEDRVSRTQFQYTLEDPNVDELNTFAPQMLAKLQKLPQLSDVASDQQTLGLRARIVFDRNTVSRLGITTSAIDQTLYDAYGQREVSTMFTQLNQYHVVLEVKPGFARNPSDLSGLFIKAAAGATGVPAIAPSIHSRSEEH